MLRRGRAKLTRQYAAADGFDLVRVNLEPESQISRRLQISAALRRIEHRIFRKDIDKLRQFMLFDIRHHFVDAELNKRVLSAFPVCQHDMRGHERGNHIHRVILIQSLENLQQLELCFKIDAVTALSLAGRHAQLQHFIQKSFGLCV